jgi:putative tryptophan/tyrosine transport system substrate-binding protein
VATWRRFQPSRELVTLDVAAILTSGTQATLAAKAATQTIPVIFCTVGAPVETGLIRSLSRSGGNVSGPSAAYRDFAAKWLELVREAVPGAVTIAVLEHVGNPANRLFIDSLSEAARALGVELKILAVATTADVDARLAALPAAGVDALIVGPDAVIRTRRREVIEAAARARLPAIYGARDYVDAGGLMSYGPDRVALGRQAAGYVLKILRGARPGDLPVTEPTVFELVVNQRSAGRIGLALSPTLLARADEVIE